VHRTLAFALLLPMALVLGPAACARAPRERSSEAPDRATGSVIAQDRPEHMVVPLAGAGTLTLERTAIERASLENVPPVAVTPASPTLEPPVPEPAEPPAPAVEHAPADPASLKAPIARGLAAVPRAGRGGRVTLDVRVDEQGDVSDALLVGSDADSLTIAAATEAALAMRYHPALLGGKPVAVWTRQVIEVKRGPGR
jgi:TonB family protein